MNRSVAKESSTACILEVRLIATSFVLLVCAGAQVGCTCVSMERQETDRQSGALVLKHDLQCFPENWSFKVLDLSHGC